MRVAALATLALLAGCTTSGTEPRSASPDTPAATETTGVSTPGHRDLDLALSSPREDSVYPDVGDPRVDALHYDLDLRWIPTARKLSAYARITFRATRDASSFQLDLAPPMRVLGSTLDGEHVTTRRRGDDLVFLAPVEKDVRYELVVIYVGRPRPVPAPTTRSDFTSLGFTVTDDGEVWTMQEPYGAHTWYPVNDHPSDKALYDFTIEAPSPWTGVANGRLVSLERGEETTTTSWQLTEPAASYLVTVAIADHVRSSNTTEDGLRVDYWVPRDMPDAARKVRVAAAAVDWIEERLGHYPFPSLGMVVTDSQSAMETQTMVTLGSTDYVLSAPVIVHELVHQWYGDQVSPADWRDVWLNEGMTMLLQWLWEDDHDVRPIAGTVSAARAADRTLRRQHGAPGAYDPGSFGESNIYYPPALMWNELRLELGDRRFFDIAARWLEEHDNTSVTRSQMYAHWERETGLELSDFFEAWIMGETTPERGVPTG